MAMFGKVTIIGLGLMGGSAAQALKKKKLARRVWAFARNRKSYRRYKKLRLVDAVTCDLQEAVRNAEIVLLCTPPSSIIAYLRQLTGLAGTDTLLMDMGSTKEEIMRHARKLFGKKNNFVGAHPMAGSEKTGAEYSSDDVYVQNICFLTPLAKNAFFRKAVRFWKSIGSIPVAVGPAAHDRIVAAVSHLPHLLSFSLVSFVPRKLRRFTAGGFESMSRLALSDTALWADIFASNKKNVVKAARAYAKELMNAASCLQSKGRKDLIALLEKRTK